MYHNIVLAACLKFLIYEGITLNSVWGNILYYIVAITVTVAIASLSYEYFEKWFIKTKVKYSKIVSGDNAATEEVVESKPV
jgi:peptidoglycan/LPS O-acetylase OafA/YrhL